MPLPLNDRRALVARLAPGGDVTADVVADAVEDGEELREVLVDIDGEVVAFTDRRALFVAFEGTTAEGFAYDAVDLRRRGDGLSVDAMVEAGRLILDVARSTFTRLGVVAEGAPPSRGTWLPPVEPKPRPAPPPPLATPGQFDPSLPALAGPFSASAPTVSAPTSAPPSSPPPGWHPDPSRQHWRRWWDGRDWTDFVADGGPQFVDPLPPRR
jgi:hypothetical protein